MINPLPFQLHITQKGIGKVFTGLALHFREISEATKRKKFQRVIDTAQKIIGCPLPTLEDLHESHSLKKAENIVKDASHPGHSLIKLLPSRKRFQSFKSRTKRFIDSFFSTAVCTLNTARKLLLWSMSCCVPSSFYLLHSF